MSMTFGAYKQDAGVFKSVFTAKETCDEFIDDVSGELVENPDYRPEFDINLSNGNAEMVIMALGFVVEDGCFEADINAFLGAAHSWLQRRLGKPTPAIETVTEGNWVYCGLREGYLNDTIMRIVVLAQAGKDRGATHIRA